MTNANAMRESLKLNSRGRKRGMGQKWKEEKGIELERIDDTKLMRSSLHLLIAWAWLGSIGSIRA